MILFPYFNSTYDVRESIWRVFQVSIWNNCLFQLFSISSVVFISVFQFLSLIECFYRLSECEGWIMFLATQQIQHYPLLRWWWWWWWWWWRRRRWWWWWWWWWWCWWWRWRKYWVATKLRTQIVDFIVLISLWWERPAKASPWWVADCFWSFFHKPPASVSLT